MFVKCTACGGIYRPIQEDGTRYFHACPGVERVIVDNGDGTFADVDADAVDKRPVVQRRVVPRPGGRNENVQRDPRTGKSRPIAEGDGTVPVPVTGLVREA